MSSPLGERRSRPRAGRFLRWYYAVKYRPFRRERRPHDGRRGLIALQIDALAYADLRRAMELGFTPTLSRLVNEDGFTLRRWFCGLPSATPYCQAGIFHGENDGIPAFRFYDKAAGRVVTCNAPEGVQYIRDRIRAPGALADGSSYVNLLDGDASTVAFTVATRERMSVYRRLGGTRMALLILLHPLRVLRMLFQGVGEWLREEWERARGEWMGRVTHAEGIFPFLRIFTNVVVRELQTIAILLDVYLGVPVIYSTFMQYDELAHHFGSTSRFALADLRRTDARIREIQRMAQAAGGRGYDLVVLSDHGMTPSVSYRVRFRESLGTTVQRILDGDAFRTGELPIQSLASFAQTSEYASVGPRVVDSVADVTQSRSIKRSLRRLGQWVRSRYGIRELVLPEKYRVSTTHGVVVTYSSCLALVYFAEDDARLTLEDIAQSSRRASLYDALREHPGIGLLAVLDSRGVHVQSRAGRARIVDGAVEVLDGANPLEPYGADPLTVRAVEALVRQPNAGDIVLFGAYDGYEIVSFDDQIGAHGSAGGDQVWPF
ncbi:MAG TPA: alkaline phosphatase family protein, partial [Gemmatimonadaceae bacterium]|nr:alkaline phosphatase family protein [Gemmatimonadaceae bacterium]